MNLRLLKELLISSVREDVYFEDVTSRFTPSKTVTAEILLKEKGVLSGVEEVKLLFNLFNITVLSSLKDGGVVPNPRRVMLIKGDSRDILLVERTALNILSRMGGITTLTTEFVKKARKTNPKIRVAATRKTTPGFRYFEKKAVETGGGDTHRMGLSDMIMIKDNHLKLLTNIPKALKEAKKHATFAHKIEVEVNTKKDALLAADHGADIIMLDNMKPKTIKEVVLILKKKKKTKNVILEASGGITLKNIGEYAKTGVDVISIGQLTSSPPALDFSLEMK